MIWWMWGINLGVLLAVLVRQARIEHDLRALVTLLADFANGRLEGQVKR